MWDLLLDIAGRIILAFPIALFWHLVALIIFGFFIKDENEQKMYNELIVKKTYLFWTCYIQILIFLILFFNEKIF